jgi:hypothetical protein
MKTTAGGMMPSFAKSPEEMDDKTAAKRLLRKPAREAEGLAMLLSLEGPEEEADPVPPMRNVTERVGERLERTLEAQGPEPAADEPPKPAAATDPQPAAQAPGPAPAKGDLF